MKLKSIGCLLLATVFAGCGPQKPNIIPVKPLYNRIDKAPEGDLWFTEVDYGGHEFVVVEGDYGTGLCHKSDCRFCEKRKHEKAASGPDPDADPRVHATDNAR